jgi:hypothetical protein
MKPRRCPRKSRKARKKQTHWKIRRVKAEIKTWMCVLCVRVFRVFYGQNAMQALLLEASCMAGGFEPRDRDTLRASACR